MLRDMRSVIVPIRNGARYFGRTPVSSRYGVVYLLSQARSYDSHGVVTYDLVYIDNSSQHRGRLQIALGDYTSFGKLCQLGYRTLGVESHRR